LFISAKANAVLAKIILKLRLYYDMGGKMKNIFIAFALVCCVCVFAARAQDAIVADTLTDIAQSDIDSLDSFDGEEVGKSDSLDVKKLSSFDDFDSDEDLEIADAPADSAASVQKLGSVKRGYDRDRQVKLAVVMMVFLVFALGTSQSFNPR
jgi:hypothetical protein